MGSRDGRCTFTGLLVASFLVALGAATETRAGSILTSSTINFVEPNAIYGSWSTTTDFPLLSGGNQLSVGAIVSGVGAKASGNISYGINGYVSPFGLSKYDLAYASSYTTGAIWSGSTLTVGDPFFLASAATPIGLQALHLKGDPIAANIGIHENLSLGLEAKACLGGCAWLKYGIKANWGQDFASINTLGTGELRVLGQEVGTVPLTYETGNGAFNISANLPNFATTIKNVPPGGTIAYSSRQNLVSAGVDVAQLIADAIGVPFPLSGSVVGFDYTLLKILATLGLDLGHDFSLVPKDFQTIFEFSSPVEIFDPATSQWSAPKDFVFVDSGQIVQARTAQPATTLSVIPRYRLDAHVDAEWTLDPFVAASIRALELSGYGLDLGPVINDAPPPLSLGTLLVDDTHQDRSIDTFGQALTLHFDPLKISNSGVTDLCASASCISTAFLPVTASLINNWSSDTFYRVTDATDACLRAGDPSLCQVDRSFTPIQTQYTQDTRGGGVQFAPDADQFLRILSMPALTGGVESNDASILADLRRLGLDPDTLGIARSIGSGALPLTEPLAADLIVDASIVVSPEPGSIWLLAGGGAVLALAGARRRRSAATGRAPGRS